jgi:hypothetical protein
MPRVVSDADRSVIYEFAMDRRAAARGLDARLRLQHHFMPAGDASLKTLRSIKNPIDSDHGTYRRTAATRLPLREGGPGHMSRVAAIDPSLVASEIARLDRSPFHHV